MEAFMAGNDILLIPDDIPASVAAIKHALTKGKIREERLEQSCKKILRYKFLTGVNHRKEVDTSNLIADLNRREYKLLQKELFSSAITVVKNEGNIIPVSYPDTLKPAVIIIGSRQEQPFAEPFNSIFPSDIFYLGHNAGMADRQVVADALERTNLVVISIVNTNISASGRFGITGSDVQFIEFIARKKPVILNIHASPYSLDFFSNTDIFEAIVISNQDKPFVQKAAAEVILGMRRSDGILPVGAGGFKAGTGISTKSRALHLPILPTLELIRPFCER